MDADWSVQARPVSPSRWLFRVLALLGVLWIPPVVFALVIAPTQPDGQRMASFVTTSLAGAVLATLGWAAPLTVMVAQRRRWWLRRWGPWPVRVPAIAHLLPAGHEADFPVLFGQLVITAGWVVFYVHPNSAQALPGAGGGVSGPVPIVHGGQVVACVGHFTDNRLLISGDATFGKAAVCLVDLPRSWHRDDVGDLLGRAGYEIHYVDKPFERRPDLHPVELAAAVRAQALRGRVRWSEQIIGPPSGGGGVSGR